MKRHLICLMVLVAALLATRPAAAAERNEFEPFGNGPPIYTRLESTDERGFHDGGWTCIPIYRDPENIPKKFNLLEVVDFNDKRVQSVEFLLDGFVITEAEDQVPWLQHYEDRDDVDLPILFVRTDALQAIDDGDIVSGHVSRVAYNQLESRQFPHLDFRRGDFFEGEAGDLETFQTIWTGDIRPGRPQISHAQWRSRRRPHGRRVPEGGRLHGSAPDGGSWCRWCA